MSHEIIPTEDGSVTLYVPELNEHYHSVHGAIQESLHIFIRAGIDYYIKTHPEIVSENKPIRILEAGFGTGLNTYLTLLHADHLRQSIYYQTLEKYPLPAKEITNLNYPAQIKNADKLLFQKLHDCNWETEEQLTSFFSLQKQQIDFRDLRTDSSADIVFFDAFNPDVQPHLWTPEVFRHFYQALKPGGILVTYCVKGIVKQALREVGFTLKRLPGPPGKREMLRAIKTEK